MGSLALLSTDMKKVESFSNPFHQAIYIALKNGDLDTLYCLDLESPIDGRLLPFEPIDVLRFYQPSFETLRALKSFFASRHVNVEGQQNYTENVVPYENGYRMILDFRHPFSQILNEGYYALSAACDETGNIEAVKDYIDAGHDLHIYREEFVRGAIEEEYYSIAELLIQNGANLKNFPTVIHRILGWESDRLDLEVFEYENRDYHYSDTRVRFALKHGAWVNSFDGIGDTPLDMARRVGHKPAFEVIREYGGRYGFSGSGIGTDNWNDLTYLNATLCFQDGTPYFGMREKAGEVA